MLDFPTPLLPLVTAMTLGANLHFRVVSNVAAQIQATATMAAGES